MAEIFATGLWLRPFTFNLFFFIICLTVIYSSLMAQGTHALYTLSGKVTYFMREVEEKEEIFKLLCLLLYHLNIYS
jgi:hypothetical protein